jgi:pyruvate kinase
VGEFSNPSGEILEEGQLFRFDLDAAKGDNKRVQLPHPEIIAASEVGHYLLIDDGKVKVQVVEAGPEYLVCKVIVGGKISNRKGVNTPDSILDISCLTPKDRSDLDYMLKIGVDWVALSFVQRPQDIEEILEIIDSKTPEGRFKPAVMAKIEKPSCFEGDNLKNIVKLCNGIMVRHSPPAGCFLSLSSRGTYPFCFLRRLPVVILVLNALQKMSRSCKRP